MTRMTTIALTAMMLMAVAAGTAAGQQQLIGEVTVEGNNYVAREPILDAVKDILKVGEPFTEEKAAQARQVILNMGYFDDVTTSIETIEGGVRVVITVVEKQRITRVMFAGNTVLSDEDLADVVLSQAGHMVNQRAIRRDVARIV
ncbi:MAG: hypothetical protein J7M38_02895, partial [Armatimonadetes bacterium]|nr:hypothetical protein [Armatimonadota bacterium]